MNFNNLQSSHGIQYIRFWRFFQFSHRKIFTCLQHSENDTKTQRDICSIDVCQVHDQTATSFHSHLVLAVTSSVLSTFFHLYCVSSLVSAISEVVFTVFSRNLSKSMQDKNMRLCAATVGDIIFRNEVFCLVVATFYWIEIWAIRWQKPKQSSCTIDELFHVRNMMNCVVVCEQRQIINKMNGRFILQSPKVLLEYYYLTGSQSERFFRCMG